jgi:hypothetical protein
VPERNGNNNGVKNSVAGFIMGPFAPKSSNISALKKMPNSTKSDAKKKVIIIWLAKVTFAFLVLHQGP